MKKTAVSIWKGLIDFMYPGLCPGCNRALLRQEKILCIECSGLLPQTNYHHIRGNATFQRLEGRVPIAHATSFGYYTKGGLLQYLVQELKYKGNAAIGDFFGQKLYAVLKNQDWIQEAELLVPVPLHPKKERSRGFNQSALVAQQLASGLGLPFSAGSLVRIVDTDSQTGKGREQRVENMENAFAVNDRQVFAGKHILLVDDILTTGATIERCVLCLREAGAAEVSVVTVGIAV